jgi:cytochrome c peroxidase
MKNQVKTIASISLMILILGYVACTSDNKTTVKEPLTKKELGEMLFSDPILSQGNQVSCASCHIPEHAFADTSATSKGVDGKRGTRNTPSAMNLAARNSFFHDGRSETLEDQAVGPIENPIEMNLPMAEAVKKLNASKLYVERFKNIYGERPKRENIIDAMVTFEKSLETSNSPFDRFMHDDTSAISESAKRGQKIFNIKGKCFDCHFGPDFTGDEFRNIGLYNGRELNDVGRFGITQKKEDIGKFKVPGLRNIAMTAPYMHNGMFKTLEEVIDYYDTPTQFVQGSINADSLLLKPLGLTVQEKSDLLEFLKSLTDERFKTVSKK